MPDIHLEPFPFDGHTLCPEVADGQPDHVLLATLVARGAMQDPELAPELVQAHATANYYQLVFAAVVDELAQIYEKDESVHAWYLDFARRYQRQHPHPRVQFLIERLQAQLVPARIVPAPLKPDQPKQAPQPARPANTVMGRRRRMLAQESKPRKP